LTEGLFCTLVDVYIRGENNEKFESVRHELNPSNKIHLALLMKYYVRRGQIEKAISILRERLRVDRTKLDLEMFHILINELVSGIRLILPFLTHWV
jgi:pentatricopeptide repeat protein